MSKSHEGRIERLVPQYISYPEQLPVVARKDEIMRAIAENQVVVIAGETGSGKTTHCLLYTSPSPRDVEESRMPSSA